MRPIQSPPPNSVVAAAANNNNNNKGISRRGKDLTLPLPLPPSSAFSSSPTGHQFSPFSELERLNRIESGSGGTVYKVVHRPTSRVFALKVIYCHHEDSVRRQIHREIQILRDVDDQNVVKCHDMYDHNGEIQVLLEFMDEGSLKGKHPAGVAAVGYESQAGL